MSAWTTPRGAAKPAALDDADEYLALCCEIVRLRLEAALGPAHRDLVAGDQSPDASRARADHLELVMRQRIAATAQPPALALATQRLGIDPLAAVAVLVGFELDERVAALACAAVDPAGDPRSGVLRVAAVAAARQDRSTARALDAILHELVPRGLASIHMTDEPARRWPVRAGSRWLALAAGRLEPADELPLREIPTADRWLAHAGGRRRSLRVEGDLPVAVLVREATLLAAAVVFATPPSPSVSSALTRAGIPSILDDQDE